MAREIEAGELSLVIVEKKAGFLTTNIEKLEAFVLERLEEYKPENYQGDADAAKKDRAELNSAKKQIADERIRIMKELMKPFDEFVERCKGLEKNIDGASKALDEIVKLREQAEKETKRAIIEEYWRIKAFELVPLDRVFDQKWLNKTAKIADVKKEIDGVIEKIITDIKTIEAFGVDVDTLKPLYLETLDLGTTIARGNAMKQNRERLEKEKAERAEREKKEAIQEAQKELIKEEEKAQHESLAENLASQATGTESETDPIESFRVEFTGKRSALFRLRQYMLSEGITYIKL
jgi:hypothetical protein